MTIQMYLIEKTLPHLVSTVVQTGADKHKFRPLHNCKDATLEVSGFVIMNHFVIDPGLSI